MSGLLFWLVCGKKSNPHLPEDFRFEDIFIILELMVGGIHIRNIINHTVDKKIVVGFAEDFSVAKFSKVFVIKIPEIVCNIKKPVSGDKGIFSDAFSGLSIFFSRSTYRT